MVKRNKETKKRRKWIWILTAIIGFLLFVVLTLLIIYPDKYVYRYLIWNTSSIDDYKHFPMKIIHSGDEKQIFTLNLNEEMVADSFEKLQYESMAYIYMEDKYGIQCKERFYDIKDFDLFLDSSGTGSLIIIQDDEIIYENYSNGYSRDSIQTSFSMAKTFVSTLIGIAIDDGYIHSVDDPIAEYLQELSARDERFSKITIRDLLKMSSGISYHDTKLFGTIDLPWDDNPKTYYYPNLRNLALFETTIDNEPGKSFTYDNYHPLLLGLILERTTGMDVSEYLEKTIWQPLGMEYDASWSVDSEATRFEKMESGINARSIDFAKFGYLTLREGMYSGQSIVSSSWLVEATSPDLFFHEKDIESYAYLLSEKDAYYKYMWWGYTRDDGEYDFYAAGLLGQYIYISPYANMVIVRNGEKNGDVNWARLFYDFASIYIRESNKKGFYQN